MRNRHYLSLLNTFFSNRDKRVDFHQAENIKEVVLSHKMDLQPGCLSAYSSSKLQYEVRWTSPGEIRWLDCSTCPPQPVDTSCVTHKKGNQIYDMCHFMDAGEPILVATHGVLGLYAYDTFENEVLWTAKGKSVGMEREMNAQALATDELGHLFVSDSNNTCIHVISTDRNQYLGTLVKEENQNLAICWCNSIASLLVAYTLDRRTYHVNLIRDTSLDIPGAADKQTDLTETTQETEDELIVDVVSDLEVGEVVLEEIREEKTTKEPIEGTDLPLSAETTEASTERTNREHAEIPEESVTENASEKSREDSGKEGRNTDTIDPEVGGDTTEDIDVSQDAVGEATEECAVEIPREAAGNDVVKTTQLELAEDLTEIVQKGGAGDVEEPQKDITEDITETQEADISVGEDAITEDITETQEADISVGEDAIIEDITETREADISVGEDAITEDITETQEADISVGEDAIIEDITETREADISVGEDAITEDITETQEGITKGMIETQEGTTQNIGAGQEGNTEDIGTQDGTTQHETEEDSTQNIGVEQSTTKYVTDDGLEGSAEDASETQDGTSKDAIESQKSSNQDTNEMQKDTNEEDTTEDATESQDGSNQDTDKIQDTNNIIIEAQEATTQIMTEAQAHIPEIPTTEEINIISDETPNGNTMDVVDNSSTRATDVLPPEYSTSVIEILPQELVTEETTDISQNDQTHLMDIQQETGATNNIIEILPQMDTTEDVMTFASPEVSSAEVTQLLPEGAVAEYAPVAVEVHFEEVSLPIVEEAQNPAEEESDVTPLLTPASSRTPTPTPAQEVTDTENRGAMDISYEQISDTELPDMERDNTKLPEKELETAECAVDSDESQTSMDEAIQMDGYKGK